MATTFSSFRVTPPIACSASSFNTHKPDPSRQNLAAKSNSWWTPLFGWSSDPDYTNGAVKIESGKAENESDPFRSDKNLFRGCFTEEKAKELRKKTMETSSFHDIMYHSAIASRLASDVNGHNDR